MKPSLRFAKLALGPLLAGALLLSAAAPAGTASAFRAADADNAMKSFLAAFYEPSAKYFYTNSDRDVHDHASGPNGGLYSDFWWEAQLWETVMDAYDRTKSPEYRKLIDDVYAGFNAKYPDMLANDFNDDLGWWAMAGVRAYELTGTQEYLNRAAFLFDRIYEHKDGTYGGGIWWKRDGSSPQKNMATNAPMVITAAKLRKATGNPAYLDKAKELYGWIESRLVRGSKLDDHVEGSGDGSVVGWDFTYNYGTYLGAALSLYEATGEAPYLEDAHRAAGHAIANLTLSGTLLDEGNNDGAAFKMVFARQLNRLRLATNHPGYTKFLQDNASQAYQHRRTSDGLIGRDWTSVPEGYVQSVAAAAGASLLQLAPPNGRTGPVAGSGIYEAENAKRIGIPTESSQAGYSGRGYLAGWIDSGTRVQFNVTSASAGARTITIRYAAGAGDAGRYLLVNGKLAAANLSFPGTGGWGEWRTATAKVKLDKGSNTIVIGLDSLKGNGNYLNVDQLYGI